MYGHEKGIGTMSSVAPYDLVNTVKVKATAYPYVGGEYLMWLGNNLLVCDLATSGTSAVVVIPTLRDDADNGATGTGGVADARTKLYNGLKAFIAFSNADYTPGNAALKFGYPVMWGADRYLSQLDGTVMMTK